MSMVYDVEDESILSTVFKDAFPDSWRGNAEFAQYLSELSSYGVDKLNREPDRLAEERSQIQAQTQDLAFHNYKTFIQTAECSKEIFQDFQVIEKHVNSLLEKLPELNTECSTFLKQAQEINNSRRMNSMTLQRHGQLLEILEVPQLMDTCVRNGYYEEALELAAHVKRLEKKHAGLPVILNIVAEVKKSTQLMLNQLIHQLRSSIQLPACLRVIGYLRRMDVFTEAELRIKFLQARDTWFQGILAAIPADDSYYHITKTIESSRVHLFDIITQYRAIFSDEDPFLTNKEDTGNEAALFHGWVIQKVSQFLAVLDQDLQRGVGGRLDSLLGQCMYFGLSFSRVGADFRGLLAPIFQKAALHVFVQAISNANQRFDSSMQSYTLLGAFPTLPSSALTLAAQTGGPSQPPAVLLEFNPLAVYCNNILSAFNDLRLCAPLSLACDVVDKIQDSLQKTAECILAYHRAEEATFNTPEAEKFSSFCRVFCEELVPYLNRCLQTLFPPASLAQLLGLHVSELTKLGPIGVMDIDAIVSLVEHLLPPKPEPPELPAEVEDLSESQDQEESANEQTEQDNTEVEDLSESHDQEESANQQTEEDKADQSPEPDSEQGQDTGQDSSSNEPITELEEINQPITESDSSNPPITEQEDALGEPITREDSQQQPITESDAPADVHVPELTEDSQLESEDPPYSLVDIKTETSEDIPDQLASEKAAEDDLHSQEPDTTEEEEEDLLE